MKLVGLMLARNEDWVIGLSARAALMWCDALVVLSHCSTDATNAMLEELAREFGERVSYTCEFDPVWREMAFRQEILKFSRYLGATHIALIDADEVLTGNLLTDCLPDRGIKSMFKNPVIREHIERTPAGTVLQLPWLQLAGHAPSVVCRGEVMTSGMWATQNVSVAFPDDLAYHWRARDLNTVASGGEGRSYDHHHRHPMGKDFRAWELASLVGPFASLRTAGLMHLQFLSRRRLIAKQFLYQLIERKRWGFDANTIKSRYVPTVTEADAAKLSPVPESWWSPYQHLLQYLHIDKEPWQEKECLRLVVENPGIERGLEDFGLLQNVGEVRK